MRRRDASTYVPPAKRAAWVGNCPAHEASVVKRLLATGHDNGSAGTCVHGFIADGTFGLRCLAEYDAHVVVLACVLVKNKCTRGKSDLILESSHPLTPPRK